MLAFRRDRSQRRLVFCAAAPHGRYEVELHDRGRWFVRLRSEGKVRAIGDPAGYLTTSGACAAAEVHCEAAIEQSGDHEP
jgi:hypothetical protein